VVKKYASETQQIDPDLIAGSQLLAWIEFWNLRFADPAWQSFLQKPFYTARLGGNTTLYVAPTDERAPKASASPNMK